MPDRIYFDYAATTPVDPRVAENMIPYLKDQFGNPSSLHEVGREARFVVEKARQQVADLLGASSDEIIFTSSGTEANNMALIGFVEAHAEEEIHIVTSAIEHPSILKTCRYLEKRKVSVTYLSVTPDGQVEPDSLQAAMRPETRLVSIMTANNVAGTIQPICELVRIARQHGALFHTDAVQAFGKLPFHGGQDSPDLISVSAHKLYGPKGIGALFVRKGIRLNSLIHGGGQERDLRASTENVPGIVGFGYAAEIARQGMASETARLVSWRDEMIGHILGKIQGSYLIGHPYRRLPGHLCLGFSGLEGDMIKLLMLLDKAGIAVSTGSACSSNHPGEASYVLQAMGLDPLKARGSLRVTLGRFNTQKEIDWFLKILPKTLAELRPMTTDSFSSR